MTITYPLDILTDFPGWSTDFRLVYRQEQSRHANGRTRVKDFGTPIWSATYVSKNLSPNKLDYFRARLNLLEGSLKTFIAYPKSRCWPISDPGGAILSDYTSPTLFLDFLNDFGLIVPYNSEDSPSIVSIGEDNKSIQLGLLPSNYILSVGDYIEIDGKLYNIVEGAVSDAFGVTPLFEVRPHLDISIDETSSVNLNKPSVVMTLVPGTISTQSGINGRGSISFQGIEARG